MISLLTVVRLHQPVSILMWSVLDSLCFHYFIICHRSKWMCHSKQSELDWVQSFSVVLAWIVLAFTFHFTFTWKSYWKKKKDDSSCERNQNLIQINWSTAGKIKVIINTIALIQLHFIFDCDMLYSHRAGLCGVCVYLFKAKYTTILDLKSQGYLNMTANKFRQIVEIIVELIGGCNQESLLKVEIQTPHAVAIFKIIPRVCSPRTIFSSSAMMMMTKKKNIKRKKKLMRFKWYESDTIRMNRESRTKYEMHSLNVENVS